MDAKKKVNLENVQCPSESKILMNIITNHPLRFSIAASSYVPWIYMARFWHTLKDDGSKHRLKFLLDRKELTLTLDDFRTIFIFPQANDNNHATMLEMPFSQSSDDEIMNNISFRKKKNKSPSSDKGKSWRWSMVQEKEEETTKDTEVEPDKDTPMVDVTNIVIPVNVDDEEDEITDEVFELRRRAKGKNVEESRISPIPSPTRSPRNLSTLISSDTEKLQELTVTHPTPSSGLFAPKLTKTNRLLSLIKAKPNRFKRYKTFFHELQGRYGYLFAHLKKRFMPQTSSDQLAGNLHDVMMETLPSLVTEKVTEQVKKEVPAQVRDQQSDNCLGKEERKSCLLSTSTERSHNYSRAVQRDPEAPALSLINQDLLYLKKGNSGPEKIVLSLHRFPAIVFNDNDIEERTSRWEEIYSNSKIVSSTSRHILLWELGHEHKFITEIVARRANDCIVSITEPDYKNLNKNDIEDMYLLIMNNKVPDYANTGLLWSLSVFIRSSVIWERVHDFQLGIESYQQKINLTAPTITFPGIEEYDVFSIVYEPVHGIIYTNSKKEKRVMRPSEIHKFCDATLRRTLEGLKSYYNDVKYGYVQKELTNDEVEFLKLFEEEIEVRLNYRDQMRRWEMYVNGRPLGPRRERPE
ncbi:hypothetical protein Tco_1213419 [Tanacetum coccineum]